MRFKLDSIFNRAAVRSFISGFVLLFVFHYFFINFARSHDSLLFVHLAHDRPEMKMAMNLILAACLIAFSLGIAMTIEAVIHGILSKINIHLENHEDKLHTSRG